MPDWRDRYLTLADQHQRDGKAHSEAERELIRLVTRLCVACSGLDPLLDPHLDRLRQAAKSGTAEGLLRRADEFADSVVRAADGRRRPSVIARILERTAGDRRRVDETLTLWAEVAADPAQAGDAQLDRLAEMLRSGLALGDRRDEARYGFLNRLIGKAVGRGEETPNQVLLDLLQAMNWPESLLEQVSAFRSELIDDGKGDAWVRTVREISGLAVRAMQQSNDDARSAEAFLKQLNQRIEDLDRHMLDETQRRIDSRQGGEQLGRRLDNEVGSLTADLRSSNNLAELQASVIRRLDRMQAQVHSHLQAENARREQAETEAGQLQRQLRDLEQATFDLRRQVVQTYHAAMRDPLTGLPNRRAYDERVAQEYARWKRFADPLALLVVDVDDFKRINDCFGHKSGDKALTMIGRILSERLRETDFLARYGGDEFVVLLTGAKRDDVRQIAESMRLAVSDGGLHANGQPVRVTVSSGVTLFTDGDSPEAVFERTDAALYQAKRQGKDVVVLV